MIYARREIPIDLWPLRFLLLFWGATSFLHSATFQFKEVADITAQPLNSVWAVFQDQTGFIYLGTQEGLVIFDGYTYLRYVHEATDPHSISSNWVTQIFQDHRGTIWVGTKEGLNRFNPEEGTFDVFKAQVGQPGQLSSNYIKGMVEDKEGHLWVGTRNGLNRFEPETETFSFFAHSQTEDSSLESLVTAIHCDQTGAIWIGTEADGAFRFRPEIGVFQQYQPIPGNPKSISSNRVTDIAGDDFGNIWLGTRPELWTGHQNGQVGLVRVNTTTLEFTRFLYNRTDSDDPDFCDSIMIYADDDGRIWAGIENGHISRLDPKTGRFESFSCFSTGPLTHISRDRFGVLWMGWQYGPTKTAISGKEEIESLGDWLQEPFSLSDYHITAIHEGIEGDVWIGTHSGGLNRINGKTRQVDQHSSLGGNRISVLESANNDELWIGYFGGGLERYEINSHQSRYYNQSDGLGDNRIRSILVDQQGDVWVGDWVRLNRLNRETDRFEPVMITPPSAGPTGFHGAVYSITADDNGILWIGTDQGIFSHNPETGEQQHFFYSDTDDTSLSGDSVRCIFFDHTGTMWVGTRSGLNRFDKQTKSFIRYFETEGLTGNVVYGIHEDEIHRLWVMTSHGISVLAPEAKVFRSITAQSGLINKTFEIGAYTQGNGGLLYFGGLDGLDIVNPARISGQIRQPEAYITQVSASDRQLIKWPQAGHHLRLEFDSSEPVVSFEFSALEYDSPRDLKYSFRLLGFDDEWSTPRNRNYASYSNLSPGQYRFEVRTLSPMGTWSNLPASAELYVHPTLLQRKSVRIALSALMILLIIGAHQVITFNIKRRNDILAEAIKRADEANTAKSRFLANTSHEIRTPLNGVIGTLNLLRESKLDEEQMEFALRAEQSAVSLLGIINDILDFSSIEAGKLELKEQPIDFLEVVESTLKALELSALAKNIYLKYPSPKSIQTHRYVSGDAVRIRQILTNLVSNAIKFTDQGGVTVTTKVDPLPGNEALFHLEVIDTGVGINPDQFNRLFAPFSQVDTSDTRKYMGTGLGLSICKELVERMQGQIGVRSVPNEGSTFWFNLRLKKLAAPKRKKAHREKEVIVDADALIAPMHILVVEDHPMNRAVVQSMLKKLGHTTHCCNDGKEGAAAALEGEFDLVLMDCQMPVMDGYEATRMIREAGLANSRIPIIALTANAQEEDRDRCLNAGMDAFLSKPITLTALKEMLAQWSTSTTAK